MKTRDPLWIDNDSGLHSPIGDVDDGFAVSALLLSHASVLGLSSTFGNTFEPWVHQANLEMASRCHYRGPVVRGAKTWWSQNSAVGQELGRTESSFRFLALGPLTNIHLALRDKAPLHSRLSELILLGTNFEVALPSWRVFDFNMWKDFAAARFIFESDVPLTTVPCDVARKLRATVDKLELLPGAVGAYLRERSRRWVWRAKYLKLSESFPVWDLVPALYCLAPEKFQVRETRLRVSSFQRVVYGSGSRPVRVVTEFDPDELWSYFVEILNRGQESCA